MDYNVYDGLGRIQGGWVCSGGNYTQGCAGGTEYYGFWADWSGSHATVGVDTVLNQTANYGYDGFGRLTSRTQQGSSTPDYTWAYDRYGNRLSQIPASGGLTSSLSFNASNNQVTTTGYTYDAAGNMTQDGPTSLGFHTYTYDAEGNITAVDGGSTATYVYNALNQRVRTVVGSTATEFNFNATGQRVSIWNGTTHDQIQGQYYWGGKPVAFYVNGATHFQHQDWMGTERVRTTYNGSVEGTFTSLGGSGVFCSEMRSFMRSSM